ncbi:uncharacterized protein LOC116289829 [Actinia tenebrosa]|uniref:Uncharacterized protein LOC116289829 n=1 Tax=Actinia tenebrosa TaxID=6105 RepID=A0A6P8H851_ACTTE|nr:uncharacterized protein LOC116289829 [Actinia tenebrosa]
MYVILMIFAALILQLLPSVVTVLSPASITREEGEDAVFMFNTNTSILEAAWGIRDGDTNNHKLVLMTVDKRFGAHTTSNADYAGRVYFVGDLSKGQAWFKITNLNINDTNNYMAKIRVHGTSFYKYIPAQLTVIKPPVTTEPLQTSTKELTTGFSSSQTSPRPTASQVPQLSNLSMSINVVKEVDGDFSDSSSEFSENFVSEINSVYRNIDMFEKAKITSLSENIISVKFVVYFKSMIKPDEICAPLEDAVKDNRLGSLKIVPGSLGCSNDTNTSFPKKQSNSASTCTSIIVACVTVNIFLILVVVFLLIYIWRLRLNTEKRAGMRNSSTIQVKNPEAYENIHPMETRHKTWQQKQLKH